MSCLPLVTIGALNYNCAQFVVETLESIKQQTYLNIELIIVDDCSTDNSVEIINEWLKSYEKPCRFIIHKENKGVVISCNELLKNASGKYISTIATDDIMLPDKIKKQISILELTGDDVGAVYSDAYFIKEDGSPRYGMFIQWQKDFEDVPSGNIFQPLLHGCFIPPMSMLVKTKCYRDIGFFDENLRYEDYDMWLRMAKKYKILFSDYVSVKYRRRSNSLTNTLRDWNSSNIKIYLKHIDYPNVITNLRWYAKKVYTEADKQGYKILVTSSVKNDHYIKTAMSLMRFKVPVLIGRRLLDKIVAVP